MNALSSGYEKAKAYASIASGLLALAIQPDERRYILAFRGEIIKNVTWGGNPDNVLTIQKDTGAYHPRNSFSVWKETVRYTSAPWSTEELSIAERFRNVIVEHTLQTLASSLEKKVQERTEALEASKRDLEITFNELMQMTYVASHDLQEPVRKIQIFSNRLRDIIGDGQGRDSLDRVLAASKRIRGLLGDLVNYSLLSHNAAPSPTDLNKIVQDVISDFDLAISDKAISIDVSELPVIQAVPDQMRQVFYSLLSNCIKFAKGDVALKVIIKSSWETSEGHGNAPSRYYRIDVADNGVGFNEKYSHRAFEMFGTLHNRDEYEGRGIGLAIAKKIIEKYNGTISASATPGEGATFSIRLPGRMVH
jgi:light-regulated signal transduction histidine kinase (bacteriophytochrome)